jgi:hypothetical protein
MKLKPHPPGARTNIRKNTEQIPASPIDIGFLFIKKVAVI